MSTSSSEILVIHPEELGRMDQVAAGGNARLYRLRDLRISETSLDLVYKEYRSIEYASYAGLRTIVRVRLQLSPHQRRILDEMAVWPLRVVADHEGRVAGVIVPLIPEQFFESILLPSGRREHIAREAQFLMVDVDRGRKTGVQVPSVDDGLNVRLRLCEWTCALHAAAAAQAAWTWRISVMVGSGP
jgi:hypothetical protein